MTAAVNIFINKRYSIDRNLLAPSRCNAGRALYATLGHIHAVPARSDPIDLLADLDPIEL